MFCCYLQDMSSSVDWNSEQETDDLVTAIRKQADTVLLHVHMFRLGSRRKPRAELITCHGPVEPRGVDLQRLHDRNVRQRRGTDFQAFVHGTALNRDFSACAREILAIVRIWSWLIPPRSPTSTT